MAEIVLGVARRHRRLQGLRGAAAAREARPRGPGGARRRTRCSSSGPPPSRRCPGARCSPGCSSTSPTSRTCALGRRADLVVLVPATADLLARMAAGRADDLLTSTLLTARCPVLAGPAMHTEMWDHPATVANVALLRAPRRRSSSSPPSGRLTGADSGAGAAPRARRDRRARPPAARGGRARCRATWWAGASSSPPAAPPSRSTRCARWATAPRAARATRSRGSPPSAAPTVTLVAGTTADLDPPPPSTLVRVQHHRGDAHRRPRRRARTPTPW